MPMFSKSKKVALYTRVSTDEQKADMQLMDLKEYVRKRGYTTYTFTKDQQELIVERQTGAATHDPTQERITLRSKRFDEQPASGDISYLKTVPSKSDEPMVLTTHKNDVLAIRNTQQVLKDFKAGR